MPQRNPWLAPLGIALLLATGFGVVLAAVGLWIGMAVELGNKRGQVMQNLIFLPDGTPLVLSHTVMQFGGRQYHDLDGNPVPSAEARGQLYAASFANEYRLPHPLDETPWEERIRTFSDARRPPNYWYLMNDGRPEGLAWFVGYDSKSNAQLGWIGKSGFRSTPPPPDDCFALPGNVNEWTNSRVVGMQTAVGPRHPNRDYGVPGEAPPGFVSGWIVFLVTLDGVIHEVDLQRRTARVLTDDPGIRTASLVMTYRPPQNTPHYRLGVRTDDAIVMLDADGRPASMPSPRRCAARTSAGARPRLAARSSTR